MHHVLCVCVCVQGVWGNDCKCSSVGCVQASCSVGSSTNSSVSVYPSGSSCSGNPTSTFNATSGTCYNGVNVTCLGGDASGVSAVHIGITALTAVVLAAVALLLL